MGYVNVTQSGGLLVSVSKGFWLYMSIAMPLIVLTIGIFFWAELLSRKALLKKLEDLPSEKYAQV